MRLTRSRSQNLLPVTLSKILFDLRHESIRRRPIDNPVVERQAEIAHWPNCDRIVNDNRAFLNCADAQNSDLRLMDDGGAEQAAEPTMVRDRECSTLNLFWIQLLGPGSVGKIRDFFRQLGQSFSIGMPNHRHQQSVIERCGDADVDIFLDDDSLLAP